MPKSKINCPHCAATLSAPEGADGKIVKCPACAKKFQVRIFDELPEVNEDATRAQPSVPLEARPSQRGGDKEDNAKEERPHRQRRESDEDDEDRPRGRPRDEDDEDEGDRPRRGGERINAAGKTDTFGVISLVLGIVSVVCLFLGCCTCGFT